MGLNSVPSLKNFKVYLCQFLHLGVAFPSSDLQCGPSLLSLRHS